MKRQLRVSTNLPEQEKQKVLNELKLGYLNLSDEMFDQAKLNFMLALQYDSSCAEAYWGMMLTKCRISNEDMLYSNPTTYKEVVHLPECQKALEFAEEDLRRIYTTLLERIFAINEGDSY